MDGNVPGCVFDQSSKNTTARSAAAGVGIAGLSLANWAAT
jgi:hypothetical protein